MYGNEFNISGMEFKDHSWFLTCFIRGHAKRVNLFLEKTCSKPKHDTNKNFKQIQNAKNLCPWGRVSFTVKFLQSSFLTSVGFK